METGAVEGIAKLTTVLKEGGPWALSVLFLLAMIYLYKAKEDQGKWFYTKLIELSTEQTATSIKLEAAVQALRDLFNSFNKRS